VKSYRSAGRRSIPPLRSAWYDTARRQSIDGDHADEDVFVGGVRSDRADAER